MATPRFIGKVEDDAAILEGEEAKHANVKRIKTGEIIEINDLKGNVYLCKVRNVSKKKVKAEILEKLPTDSFQPKVEITLYLAIPNRPAKVDELIESLSQLGVSKLVPVLISRTAVKKKDVKKKLEKWRKIALNSIKQCKRLYPLSIEEPIGLGDIIPSGDLKVFFYEREREKTLKELCKESLNVKSVDVIIGNEGGFTEEEATVLIQKGFEPYSLGNLILTMETAVIAGISQLNLALY